MIITINDNNNNTNNTSNNNTMNEVILTSSISHKDLEN